MQLSVIILNYNVRYFLELCLESVQLALASIESEIIVVDNASNDGSAAMIREQFPDVRWIQNHENLGFPKGNNIGVEAASGKYVCILNPDTVVAEDTFVKVLNFAAQQENLGIVGVKLIDGTGNFLPESKRGIPTPWVAFTKIIGSYRLLPRVKMLNRYYATHLQPNQTGKVEILVGAFMLMTRQLYQQMEGFDEACFMYADDIDLSYRVLQNSKYNWFFSETTVIHFKGESTSKDETYRKRFQEAMIFFYRKHFKRTYLLELMMSLGTVFFSVFKTWQGVSIKRTPPLYYQLWSKQEWLAKKLGNQLGKNVFFELISNEKLVHSSRFSIKAGTEIILDSSSLSFKEIIAVYEKVKNCGCTLKIVSPKATFLIGSNSNNERGEVVKIN